MCLHGKIKLIHASKLHLHERFEQKRLAKLTDSLCFDKVLRDPISVLENDGKYIVLDGVHRFLALQSLVGFNRLW